MKIKNQIVPVLLNLIFIIAMIALISVVKNDYILTGIYAVIIAVALLIKYQKKDLLFFVVGSVAMIFFEYIFISTSVEIFIRKSLFGLMPLWLPILWGFAFVVIKRIVILLK